MLTAPERLTAALADRYRLQRELGAGGMATVYLADDLKHSRQVAVKVLRPELAESLGIDRFLREINHDRAVRIAASASVLSAKAGVIVEHPMLPGIGEKIAELRASIPAAEIEACVSAGRVASPAEVVAMLAG